MGGGHEGHLHQAEAPQEGRDDEAENRVERIGGMDGNLHAKGPAADVGEDKHDMRQEQIGGMDDMFGRVFKNGLVDFAAIRRVTARVGSGPSDEIGCLHVIKMPAKAFQQELS